MRKLLARASVPGFLCKVYSDRDDTGPLLPSRLLPTCSVTSAGQPPVRHRYLAGEGPHSSDSILPLLCADDSCRPGALKRILHGHKQERFRQPRCVDNNIVANGCTAARISSSVAVGSLAACRLLAFAVLLAGPFGRDLLLQVHRVVAEARDLHDRVPDAVQKQVRRLLSGAADVHEPCVGVNLGPQLTDVRVFRHVAQRKADQLAVFARFLRSIRVPRAPERLPYLVADFRQKSQRGAALRPPG